MNIPSPSEGGAGAGGDGKGSGEPAKPDRRQWTDTFCREWEKTYGRKYPFDGPVDGGAIGRLMRTVGDLPTFEQVCRAYLRDGKQWLREAGHPLATLGKRARGYMVQGGEVTPGRSVADLRPNGDLRRFDQ